MFDEQDNPTEKYGRDLAAASYPVAIDLPHLPTAFLRKWVLRTNSVLPAGDALESATKTLEEIAQRKIVEVLGNDAEADVRRHVSVSAVRLGDQHVVLEMVCPGPSGPGRQSVNFADAATIATISILKEADKRWKLEALQGVPKSYWFIMK